MKINKLNTIIEILKLRNDKKKEKNKYYYLNKYKFKNGKKDKEIIRVKDEELPDNESTIKLWEELYQSNVNINLENDEINKMIEKYIYKNVSQYEEITDGEKKGY